MADLETYGTEAEHATDDGTLLGIIGDVVEDFLDKDIPASVVLFIVAIIMAREVMGFWLKMRGRK